MKPTERGRVAALGDLPSLLRQAEGFGDILAALSAGRTAGVDGAWGSTCALTCATLAEAAPSDLLIVLPRIADVDDFALDVAAFREVDPLVFPAWESLPAEHDVADVVFGGRLRVLRAMEDCRGSRVESREPEPEGRAEDRDLGGRGSRRTCIVTSLPALLQPVPSLADIGEGTRTLRVGEEIELDRLLTWLVERGCERVGSIEQPGEFAVHGGILDVYPPDAADPLRFEFFGNEIESIRTFDVETQRRIDTLDEAAITLVVPGGQGVGASEDRERVESPESSVQSQRTSEPSLPLNSQPSTLNSSSLLDYLPSDTWIALTELTELVDEGRSYLQRLDDPRGMFGVEATLKRCQEHPTVTVAAVGGSDAETVCRLRAEPIERFAGPKSEVLGELAASTVNDRQVLIACHNDGERERFQELLAESPSGLGQRVTLCLGRVDRGFRLVDRKLVVIGDHELFGRTEVRRVARRKRRTESRAIDSFLELRQNDLVVHLVHGIGRYRGMKRLEKDGQEREFLVLEFRDAVRMFVPVSLIHLVQKYVGAAKSTPILSKLGGTAWDRKKARVAEAVADMASDMIELQAARESKPGIAYPPDSHLQQEFEASFPYTETDDQLSAIEDLKGDMQRERPMDRLICGDVGYGKTEVAMRAAFKAIESGRQVAVLVPTTVLAEQHFRTFSERMAEYPFNVDVISRFRNKGEQQQILEALANGGVDVIIGTHRLVQKDIRFKNLGLLVIDEEQRFGVDAKDTLKRLRLEVDVLTLSATPIPRTLHMSLLGVRDISNLVTPPQDRQSIETRIVQFDAELIRMAIVRELNRGGQVYFVHNRVHNIQEIADRVQQIVPEAAIGIGHGQMAEGQLARAMRDFVAKRTDVLVCTTIIESGLDIPNANTIFIHQAGIYGLADMHQLRGRVGRYKHRAYCYLVLEDGKPLTPQASKRLKAIREYSELGAGFRIAMRDLEIRGAGNILGTEQSGHISAVGYELYCQLLENAVRRVKNEKPREYQHVAVDLPVTAFWPDDYIPAGRQKIEMYRKLSLVDDENDLAGLTAELRDRFGPPPESAERLLSIKELQLAARFWQIDDIHVEEGYVVFGYKNAGKMRDLKKMSSQSVRIVDARNVYVPIPPDALGEGLAEWVKSVLRLTA